VSHHITVLNPKEMTCSFSIMQVCNH